jgi:uncharacterized YigZ family protein
MESDTYTTIKSPSQGIYKEKGSRFIAFTFPLTSAEEVKPIVDKIRKENHDAKHHCYAYMIGLERNIWRYNDDGEPSGTAGRPILGQINSFGLTNVLIVVSRHFGGTLLGVSGLINAYKTAAASAIANSEIIERTLQDFYKVTFSYVAINDVMKILKEENVSQSDQLFDLDCSIKINFRASSKERILNRFSRIEGLKSEYIETK